MYQIKQHNHSNVFYVRVSGELDHNQLIDMLKEVKSKSIVGGGLKVISDYSKALLPELHLLKLADVAQFFSAEFVTHFSLIQWAHLSHNPKHMAGSLIFGDLTKNQKFIYRQFSHLENALNWICFPGDFIPYDSKISEVEFLRNVK